MTCQRAVDIHPQQSFRLGAAKGGLSLLDVGDQRQATLVIGLAVQRRADLPRGPLQEAHAEARFKLLDRIGHRRARQAEILRCQREASPLHSDCSSLADCDAG